MTIASLFDEAGCLNLLRKDLRRDLRDAELAQADARYLVDVYYQLQDFRIQAGGQLRSEQAEPRRWVESLQRTWELLEKDFQTVLGEWARRRPEGLWAQSITGVGPVISAGLAAHIDVSQAPTVGKLWRFAGLDPTVRWEKGQKRPWNARLKVLCWKLGDSFVKQSGRESDVYGHVYRARKALELERDAAGQFADQAAATLEARRITDKALKATYESGHLPLGRLELRARRYAVKLFLSHYHHVAYESMHGQPPPMPYIFTDNARKMGLGDHTHWNGPPNWPMMEPGVKRAPMGASA